MTKREEIQDLVDQLNRIYNGRFIHEKNQVLQMLGDWLRYNTNESKLQKWADRANKLLIEVNKTKYASLSHTLRALAELGPILEYDSDTDNSSKHFLSTWNKKFQPPYNAKEVEETLEQHREDNYP